MTKEAYIRAVMRNLRLPRKIKKRIKNDLLSDFTARIEAGETQEQIIKDMGTPDIVAAEFHENFAGQLLPQRTPLDWFLLIAGILFGAIALLKVLGEVLLPAVLSALFAGGPAFPEDVAIIGGADGPTAVFVTGSLAIGSIQWIGILLPLLLCALFVGAYLWHRRKKKSSIS